MLSMSSPFSAPVRVDVWADVVCPFCWIGKARLERAAARAGVPVEVVLHAFRLHPEETRTMPLRDYLAGRFGPSASAMQARTEAMGRADGLPFDMGRAVYAPTLDAHRLILLAQDQGRGNTMAERLMRAHFAEGLDVSDRDVLLRLAQEAGLDRDAAAAGLASDAQREEVLADEAAARASGIRGVPFFVLDGRHALSGAQPVETFEEALRLTLAEREAPAGKRAPQFRPER